MTKHTKKELEEMLYDVVDELDLSDVMIDKHGPSGTPPAVLVREVLAQKDLQISMLRRGLVEIGHNTGYTQIHQARLAQEVIEDAKETLHNKRLIAAAPYLLNALQMLYEETVDYIMKNNLGGMDNQCMQMARNALAMCSLNWRT